MSKMVGRIPADQAKVTSHWALPEVNPESDKQSVIRLGAQTKQGKISRPENQRVKQTKQKPSTNPSRSSVEENKSDDTSDQSQADIDALLNGDLPSASVDTVTSESTEAKPETTEVQQQTQAAIAEPEPEPDPAPSAEPLPAQDLDEFRQEVKLQAQQEGREEGHQQGKKEGHEIGYAEGLVKGEAEGIEKGLEQGRAEAEKSFEAEVDEKRSLLADLQRQLVAPAEDPAEMETALLALVTQLAEVVILNELKTSPEQVAELVSAALEAVPHGVTQVDVYVNPESMVWAKRVASPIDARITYLEDENIAVGSCRVSSERSNVDGNLSKRINEALLHVIGGEDLTLKSESDLLKAGAEISAAIAKNEQDRS